MIVHHLGCRRCVPSDLVTSPHHACAGMARRRHQLPQGQRLARQAEHLADSLSKGSGDGHRPAAPAQWETPEGDKRSITEIEADESAPAPGGLPPSPSEPPARQQRARHRARRQRPRPVQRRAILLSRRTDNAPGIGRGRCAVHAVLHRICTTQARSCRWRLGGGANLRPHTAEGSREVSGESPSRGSRPQALVAATGRPDGT
jgi:hypothetical protein